MSCCGQKRLALAQGHGAAQAGRGMASRPNTGTPHRGDRSPGEVALRYLGPAVFQSRSIRTGRVYACTGTGALLRVDARDADALLRTGLFQR